jgi:hypothetical protein
MGDMWVGYHHEELVSQEEGEEWAVLLRPNVQSSLWVSPQEGITQEGPRGYGIAVLIDYVIARAERHAVNQSDGDHGIK